MDLFDLIEELTRPADVDSEELKDDHAPTAFAGVSTNPRLDSL